MRRNPLCFLLLVSIIGVFCLWGCSAEMKKADLTILCQNGGSFTVKAELAVTDAEQQRGFMERKTIPDGTGMLFVMERDARLSFWMKNTPTPLSIAYIDSRGVIREMFDMTPFSLETVNSTHSVRYALEVPKGWFAKNGIAAGDTVVIPNGL